MAWLVERSRSDGSCFELGWVDREHKCRRSRAFRTAEAARQYADSAGLVIKTRGPRMPGGEPLPDRIRRMSAVDPETGCWIWQARLTNVGYGQIMLRDGQEKPRSGSAHRTSYEVFVGPIPEGLVLDHLCRVRSCVNPEHLEPVTQRENVMRSPIAQAAINAAKTHCAKGHPYDEENTYHGLHRNGTTRIRLCRQCMRDYRKRVA